LDEDLAYLTMVANVRFEERVPLAAPLNTDTIAESGSMRAGSDAVRTTLQR